jgi:hypothetical protein
MNLSISPTTVSERETRIVRRHNGINKFAFVCRSTSANWSSIAAKIIMTANPALAQKSP